MNANCCVELCLVTCMLSFIICHKYLFEYCNIKRSWRYGGKGVLCKFGFVFGGYNVVPVSRLLNTLVYTIFFVDAVLCTLSLLINTFSPLLEVTLEIATYNCPRVKTGFCRNKPTFFNDCP